MEPIITEQKNYLHLLIPILVSTIIVVGSYFLYQEYQKRQVVPNTTPATLSSYGLDQPFDPDNRPFGTITYTAETDSLPYVYRLNLEDNTTDLLTTQSFTAAVPLSATSSIVIKDNTVALYDHDTETLTTLPHQTNSIITDLTISPDQTRYAYSFREADIADPENLGAYSIAVHTLGTDQVEVIAGGGKAGWLGSDLAYLGKQGIYQHSFETGEAKTIFTTYAPFKMSDGLAVSPNVQTIILTKANKNLLSILTLENPNTASSTLVEKGRIVTNQTSYYSPVISPDGTSYAVQAMSVQNLQKNPNGKYDFTIARSIEVRQIGNKDNIQTVPLTGFANSRVYLNTWAMY